MPSPPRYAIALCALVFLALLPEPVLAEPSEKPSLGPVLFGLYAGEILIPDVGLELRAKTAPAVTLSFPINLGLHWDIERSFILLAVLEPQYQVTDRAFRGYGGLRYYMPATKDGAPLFFCELRGLVGTDGYGGAVGGGLAGTAYVFPIIGVGYRLSYSSGRLLHQLTLDLVTSFLPLR